MPVTVRNVTSSAVLACFVFGADHVRADCGQSSLGRTVLNPTITAMFQGTVIEVRRERTRRADIFSEREIVTFNVDRVWKGNVARVLTLYRPRMQRLGVSIGPQTFHRGRRYIVGARPLTLDERQRVGGDLRPEALTGGYCGDGTMELEVAERNNMIEELGVSRPPDPVSGSLPERQ